MYRILGLTVTIIGLIIFQNCGQFSTSIPGPDASTYSSRAANNNAPLPAYTNTATPTPTPTPLAAKPPTPTPVVQAPTPTPAPAGPCTLTAVPNPVARGGTVTLMFRPITAGMYFHYTPPGGISRADTAFDQRLTDGVGGTIAGTWRAVNQNTGGQCTVTIVVQ